MLATKAQVRDDEESTKLGDDAYGQRVKSCDANWLKHAGADRSPSLGRSARDCFGEGHSAAEGLGRGYEGLDSRPRPQVALIT